MAEPRYVLVDVSLDCPAAALPAPPPPATGVVVVFWSGGVPLGRVTLTTDQLPLTASQMALRAAEATAPALVSWLALDRLAPETAAVEAALPRLGRPLEHLRSAVGIVPAPDIAVVVCTRDRPEPLARCLESLVRLDPVPRDVLVVVNGPDEGGRSRAVVARFPGVRVIVEPRPGLSRARNAGLRGTRSAFVAFTDDDVVVSPRWVGALGHAFATSDAASVTGLVLPATVEGAGQVYFELGIGALGKGFVPQRYDTAYFAAHRAVGVPVWMIGAGANMAFRRSALEAVGGFDERLGAGASGCSEDSEMWYRLLAAGECIAYRPDCVVHHAHRSTDEEVALQMEAYMRGHVAALLVQYRRHQHWGNLRRALWHLSRHQGRKLVAAWRGSDPWRRRVALAEWRGYLAGLRPRYLKAAAVPPLEETLRRP